MLLGQLNWPLPSFSSQHTVTGTIGEFRPYSVTDGNPCRFHRGVDMTNGANLNVYAIETGTVNIDAASGKNAQITINGSHNLVYIHVIAVPGVEFDEIIFAGDLLGVMYTDGAGSWAEHCHLQEFANNLLSSDLFPFIDLHSVTIENISFFTDGLIYTTNASTPFTENTLFPEGEFITLYNKIDILADIADKRVAPDGSSAGGATAPYSISYSIYNLGGELVSTVFNNYKFNSFPDNTEAIYAFGANSNDHNFEYIITNNPFSLPWDRYWNSNQRLDFPESTWPKDNSHDARLAAEAKYLDGKYLIEVNTSDIDYDLTGNNTVETVNILIDNFRPFIEKVQMMAGLDIVYNANWTWDGTTLNFNPSIGAINGTAPINVQVTSSEPLLSLNLSIPELGILSEGMNAVPGNNNMLWEFPLIESDFVAAVDGEYYQIVLEGFDYANNNLEINPANIPIRQIDGTWSPAPISGSDANHQFLFSGDGGVVLPTSFISNYQYWFDDNYLDNVTGSTVEVGEFNFNQAVDVSMLSNGMHSFHIRFKDNNSLWSSVLSQVFVKTQTGLADNVINGGEYWFDDNYAGHNDLVGINAASFNFIDNIDVYSLTNGLHSFHIRFKDANNLWSSVLTQFFVKVPQITTPNLISTYEYWYDSDTYASAISVTLPTPINPYYLNDVVDVSALTEASHTIHFRFQDINGLWSSVVTDTFTREPLILADFTVSPISICAGASVTFDNLS